jgi:acyl-CoA reductase-like NAD-dependent aldehyde dehydrogenase
VITAHHQPRRDMISSTGSTRVGKRSREVAAATVKRLTG